MDLEIRIKEIKGICPVYSRDDVIFVRNGYILDTNHSSPVCLHSLASLMPYYAALSHDVPPQQLGLSQEGGNKAYVQCLDPCEITGGGTVIFEISVLKDKSP